MCPTSNGGDDFVHKSSASPVAQILFKSFDGGIEAQGRLKCPDRYRYLTTNENGKKLISRGAGLSYSAASFCEGVLSVEHSAFNRVIDFDSEHHVVEVEPGIELSTLHNFLSSRGLFLPIQPGHGRITVGGCIAADVHGKNHAKDGTFINQVVELNLFHPDHGLITLSPEVEPELFRLTCGGYGLTGHIVRAKLRARPLNASGVRLNVVPVQGALLGVKHLASMALGADFAYTWHDFMDTTSSFGRGYIFLSNFVSIDDEKDAPARNKNVRVMSPKISSISRAAWRLPLFNRWTAKILNYAYHTKQSSMGYERDITLNDALFPVHDAQFYFKLFGRRGFHEYQVIVPLEFIEGFLDSIREYLSLHPLAVTLASAKLFRGQPELIRFTGDGVCFSLNFPRTQEAQAFLNFLDQLIVRIGGIPNIIKDSRLPLHVLEACYPNVYQFREQLRAFDPKRIFCSEISKRLKL
jgi:decaprenylphospho-beta-D-ribofuranose 2-oxidase